MRSDETMSSHSNANRRARRAMTAIAVAVGVALPAVTTAQVPGLPVLQNAFVNRGLAFAGNFGGGTGQSYYGLAAAWGLGGRFALSGGAGAQHMGTATRGAYGGRAAMTLWSRSGGSLGAGAFVGFGGAPRTRTNGVVTNAAVMIIPAGGTISWRHAMGSRGFSLYASPMYQWTRVDAGAGVASSGTFAASAGLDFAISNTIGATIGGQFGQAANATPTGGKNSGTFGAAVSFVPGGRQQ
jgi:hypothetical protein